MHLRALFLAAASLSMLHHTLAFVSSPGVRNVQCLRPRLVNEASCVGGCRRSVCSGLQMKKEDGSDNVVVQDYAEFGGKYDEADADAPVESVVAKVDDEEEEEEEDDEYLEQYDDDDDEGEYDALGLLGDDFEDEDGDPLFFFADSSEFDINYKKLEELKALDEARLANRKPKQMDLNMQAVSAAREAKKLHELDNGSPQYQVAALTERIKYLTVHMINNKSDFSCRRGLVSCVNKRRKHLDYIHKSDPAGCAALVKELGIRYKPRGNAYDKPTKYGAFKNTKSRKARNLDSLDHVVVQK